MVAPTPLQFLLILGFGIWFAHIPRFSPCSAEEGPNQELPRSVPELRATIKEFIVLTDALERSRRIDWLWSQLTMEQRVPFTAQDRVCFLFRGPASSVGWRGDFNDWQVSSGERQGDSDLWILELTLPEDARVDYKVFLNGTDWILDPVNPRQVKSGLGFNSELRMPKYSRDRVPVDATRLIRGSLLEQEPISSVNLGYDVGIRFYLPPGFSGAERLPVVVVTDGHEYADPELGDMTMALDQLVSEGSIRPVVVIFVDPRDVKDLHRNRRAEQYDTNDAFLKFITKELLPWAESKYKISGERHDRTLVGTSLGGLFAAYAGIKAPEVFGNLGIQSPAFQAAPQIYDLYREERLFPMHVFLSGGRFGDNKSSRAILPVLKERGYEVCHLEVNEGHSWGAWRTQLRDLLQFCVGKR